MFTAFEGADCVSLLPEIIFVLVDMAGMPTDLADHQKPILEGQGAEDTDLLAIALAELGRPVDLTGPAVHLGLVVGLNSVGTAAADIVGLSEGSLHGDLAAPVYEPVVFESLLVEEDDGFEEGLAEDFGVPDFDENCCQNRSLQFVVIDQILNIVLDVNIKNLFFQFFAALDKC